MKIKIIYFFLVSLLSVSTLSFAQKMDFKDIVEITLSQNAEIHVSSFRLQQAEAALKEAKAARLPQITASITSSLSDNALNVFGMKLQQAKVVQSDFIPRDLNNPGAYTDFNPRIEMLVPVWNGGKVVAYQNQAKAMIKASQYGDEAVRQFLIFNVYHAYEGVHTARRYIEVAEKGVKAAESYVKTTENLMRQGLVVRSELLTAQVSLSKAKIMLDQAVNKEMTALDGLRSLMNMSPDEAFEIGQAHVIDLPANSVEKLISLAMSQNPRLDAKRHEATSLARSVDAIRADTSPSFNIMARNDWHDESLGLNSSSYTVAAVASWKFADFGVNDSAVDRANAAVNEKKSKLRSEENKIQLEILTAWRNLQLNKKQAINQKATIEQAIEAQRLVKMRYKNGVATMTELLNSQVMLDKTRADLVRTEFTANMYKAKLRLTTGSMSLADL